MPRQPEEPSPPKAYTSGPSICAAKRFTRLGEIEAPDEAAAIEAGCPKRNRASYAGQMEGAAP
jgi:hypothetical protein